MELAQRRTKTWLFLPAFGVAGFGMLFLLVFLVLLLGAGAGGSSQAAGGSVTTGNQNLSQECERYRPVVERYANQYGMGAFVDVLMAMMMQESGGTLPDVMQSSEYAGMPRNTITNPEVSINYGVQAIRDAMQAAGCTSPAQMDLLKLALQGYNFGSGYVGWAKSNYGGYTKENALEFSIIMKNKTGWLQYGDPLYVDHVFQFLTFTQGGDYDGSIPMNGICEEAQRQLVMLQKGWPSMDERRGQVIARGATRIGKTTYSMYGEDTRSGVDNPRTLDCSSFVAWSFQKAGFPDVPYASTTGTFVSSQNFVPISASDLIPGDIGLKNMIPSGGDNHVGLYAGKDENGTQMWLHCTTSLTAGSAVVSGPRVGYYTNFYIFYRYTGFTK